MKISSNFSLVLSPKVNQSREITTVTSSLKENNKDEFVSKNSVSFKAKAKAPIDKVTQMIKSSSYWKVVGATVAATAAAIWKMLTDAGVKDEEVTVEQIQKMIEAFIPKDVKPSVEEDAVAVESTLMQEDEKNKLEKTKNADEVISEDIPVPEKKKSGRPKKVKTINMDGGKQVAENNLKNKQEIRAQRVKELLEQGKTQRQIAAELGISQTTVSHIVNKNGFVKPMKQSKVEENKETLEQQAEEVQTKEVVLEQKAEEKAETIQETKEDQVVEEVKTENVDTELSRDEKWDRYFNDLRKKMNEEYPGESLWEEFINNPLVNIEVNEELEQRIKELQKEFRRELDIIDAIGWAEKNVRINNGDIERFVKYGITDVVPQAPETIKNSLEYLFDRIIAKSYNLMCSQAGSEHVESFIQKTTSPRMLLTTKNTKFDTHVWHYKDTVVPKDDPLFEQYKACFDKKAILLQMEALKLKFYSDLTAKLLETNFVDLINAANEYELEIDGELLFSILLNYDDWADMLMAVAKVPAIQDINGEENQTQVQLKEGISKFKTLFTMKEYIDLVKVFNAYCANNYNEKIAEDLSVALSSITDVKDISSKDYEFLKEILAANKKGIDFDSVSGSKVEEISPEQKYADKDYESLVKSLHYFYSQVKDEELSFRIADFSYNSLEEEVDVAILRKFLILLERVQRKEITEEKVNEICVEENIKPVNSEIDSLMMQKKKTSLIEKITQKANTITGRQRNKESNIVQTLEKISDQIMLGGMGLDKLKELYSELDEIDKKITYDTIEAENYARILADKYLPADQAKNVNMSDKERYLAQKDAEYTDFLAGKFEIADAKFNFVREKYLASLGTKMEISLEEAKKCLAKVDSYNSLSDKDKTYITKILSIFDEKTGSELEKDVLKMIVEKEYMNVDTIIKHEVIDELIIPKKNKKLMYKSARKSCDLFRLNEESGKVFAQRHTNGLELMPNDSDYKAHIRILTEGYGATRLSSKKGVQKVKDKDGNEKTIIYLDTFRDKH